MNIKNATVAITILNLLHAVLNEDITIHSFLLKKLSCTYHINLNA